MCFVDSTIVTNIQLQEFHYILPGKKRPKLVLKKKFNKKKYCSVKNHLQIISLQPNQLSGADTAVDKNYKNIFDFSGKKYI